MRNLLSGLIGFVGLGSVAIACASDAGEPRTGEARSALSQNLVIAGVYGGGGNSMAIYTHDYVILFNRGNAATSLNGLSLQYRSATSDFEATTDVLALPNSSLQPGQYFLVQLNSNGNPPQGVALPTPDLTGDIGLSNTNGKIAVVTQPLDACGAAGNPCPATNIVDLVGYGTATQYEGAGADGGTAAVAGLSNTVAAIRKDGGCTETDHNANDFETGVPLGKNTATTFAPCGAPPDSGSGGSDAATGGASGAAGAATGGTAGASAGGSAGSSTGGTAGSASGGSGGSTGGTGGGATGGSGGAATGGSGGSASGGVGALGGFGGSGGKKSAPAEEDEGCGCSTPGSNGSPIGAVALAGLVLAIASRRRRS